MALLPRQMFAQAFKTEVDAEQEASDVQAGQIETFMVPSQRVTP